MLCEDCALLEDRPQKHERSFPGLVFLRSAAGADRRSSTQAKRQGQGQSLDFSRQRSSMACFAWYVAQAEERDRQKAAPKMSEAILEGLVLRTIYMLLQNAKLLQKTRLFGKLSDQAMEAVLRCRVASLKALIHLADHGEALPCLHLPLSFWLWAQSPVGGAGAGMSFWRASLS